MSEIEEKLAGGDRLQSRAAADGSVEKRGVLGERGVGIAGQPFEDVAPVGEGSAMHVTHKQAVMHLGRASPELPTIELKKARIAETGDVGGIGQQRRDLGAEAVRGIPVVIVPMDDDGATRQLAGAVALGADTQSLLRVDVADSRIDGQIVAMIGAVINDDEFAFVIILALEIGDRLQHPVTPVAGRHDAADKGSERRRRRSPRDR